MGWGLGWRDLLQLRAHLVAALLLGLAGLALAAGSSAWLAQQRAANAQAQQTWRSLVEDAAAVQAEQDEYAQQFEGYRALVRRGILGPEQRLQWVMALRASVARRRLPPAHYDFAAQRQLGDSAGGKVQLRASSMELRLQLLHEGDLLAILADLELVGSGYPRLQSCMVERLAEVTVTALAKAKAALQAQCRVDWLSLQLPSEAP